MTPLEKAAIEAEYSLICETLKKNRFNKSEAAKELQIDRKTLYNKIKAYERVQLLTSLQEKGLLGVTTVIDGDSL